MGKKSRTIFFLFIVLGAGIAACGGRGRTFSDDIPTQSFPRISRVDPAAGPAGSVIRIYGAGFSDVAANNVVIIGSASTPATDYSLANPATSDEVEVLTATVPADLAAKVHPVTLLVHETASNNNKTFTIP